MNKTLPHHIAIILDGNRRWARMRHLPTFAGHIAGLKQAKKLVQHCKKRGIRVVTLYGFSTENWKRDAKEVSYLMKLFAQFLKVNIKEFIKEGAQLRLLGDPMDLPKSLRDYLKASMTQTKKNTQFIVQLALNYGGRDEIVRAFERYIADKNNLPLQKPIAVNDFEKYLDTYGVPDPDLIIRTSGEQRISNFLIWQGAYSEIFFAPEFLPDFTPSKLDTVIAWYQDRSRRYGS